MPRRPYRRSRGPRKRYSWTNHTLNEQTVGGGSALNISDILDGLTAAEKADVGTIESVSWQGMRHQFASGSECHGRWGLIIVTPDAFVGAAPDALGDHQLNWYWNQAYQLDEPDTRNEHFEGKTLTKRRMPSSDHIMAMVWESAAAAATSLVYDIALRVLYSHR